MEAALKAHHLVVLAGAAAAAIALCRRHAEGTEEPEPEPEPEPRRSQPEPEPEPEPQPQPARVHVAALQRSADALASRRDMPEDEFSALYSQALANANGVLAATDNLPAVPPTASSARRAVPYTPQRAPQPEPAPSGGSARSARSAAARVGWRVGDSSSSDSDDTPQPRARPRPSPRRSRPAPRPSPAAGSSSSDSDDPGGVSARRRLKGQLKANEAAANRAHARLACVLALPCSS